MPPISVDFHCTIFIFIISLSLIIFAIFHISPIGHFISFIAFFHASILLRRHFAAFAATYSHFFDAIDDYAFIFAITLLSFRLSFAATPPPLPPIRFSISSAFISMPPLFHFRFFAFFAFAAMIYFRFAAVSRRRHADAVFAD
jgi:hypothetical protein